MPDLQSCSAITRIISCAVILCTFLLTVPMTDCAETDTWYPPGYHGTAHEKTHPGHSHASRPADDFNPLVQGVRFFQKFISPVDSPRCPMYPTCSSYALQALRRHGPVVGSFLTVDRLLHETSPEEQTIPIQGFERTRYYDPLDANDFWLDTHTSDAEP